MPNGDVWWPHDAWKTGGIFYSVRGGVINHSIWSGTSVNKQALQQGAIYLNKALDK